jgi:hypothetical protein
MEATILCKGTRCHFNAKSAQAGQEAPRRTNCDHVAEGLSSGDPGPAERSSWISAPGLNTKVARMPV